MKRSTILGVMAVAALVALAGCGGASKSGSGDKSGGGPVDAARQAAIVAEQIQRFESGPGELSNVTCQPGAGTYACDATWELASDQKQIQITATLTGNTFQATSPQVQQDFSASGAIPTDTAYRGLDLRGLKAWSDAHAIPAAGRRPDPNGVCKVGTVDRTFSCDAFEMGAGDSGNAVPFRVTADGRATIANSNAQEPDTVPNAGKDLGFLPKDFK